MSILYPMTIVVLVLASCFTLTYSKKPSFTGTPTFNFFPFVGISQPLGVELESPSHITGPRLLHEVEYMLVFVEFNSLMSPFSKVQNATLLSQLPFTLII